MVHIIPWVLRSQKNFRDFLTIVKQCIDRSEGSSMSEGTKGLLELEIMYMVLVVSEEGDKGWISSRIVMSDS